MSGTDTAAWRVQAADEYRTRKADLVRDCQALMRQAAKLKEKISQKNQEIKELDVGAKAFGIWIEDAPPATEDDNPASDIDGRSGPLFKDLALELLRKSYPRPMRANDIRDRIESRLKRKFHSKTTGMSLYRLSKDGSVRRDGWDWFYVPSADEEAEISEIRNGSEGLEDLLDK